MLPTTLIYLHGFRSSSASGKATVMRDYMRAHHPEIPFHVPDLPDHPRDAIARTTQLIEARAQGHQLGLIGSSLGGFYATFLAERFGGKAALINPAVSPVRELESYVGDVTNMHNNEVFAWTRSHLDELKRQTVAQITNPSRYYLLVETGDEVLDYREAVAHYAGAKQYVGEGGDHRFQAFEEKLSSIVAFLCN